MAVGEMEAAATEQLQSLASKSEAALKSSRTKLNKAEGRVEEFQALIKVKQNKCATKQETNLNEQTNK